MIKRNAVSIERDIRAQWGDIVRSARVWARAADVLPIGRLELLGSSLKTELSESLGVLTGVCYMSPASTSGRNACSNSTAACRAGCLGEHAGRMPMIKDSMLWKTALRFGAPELYRELMTVCIARLRARAFKAGKIAAVRMDGTSDFGDAERYAIEFPDVSFYEYTKSAARAARWHSFDRYNLSATLSFSGGNLMECLSHIANGGNVAVPFDQGRGTTLPNTWRGFPVLDGDAYDFRSHDAPGHVVGLRWKGPKRTRDQARANGWFA